MIDRESERKLIRRETALAVPESTTWDTSLRGGSWYLESSPRSCRLSYRRRSGRSCRLYRFSGGECGCVPFLRFFWSLSGAVRAAQARTRQPQTQRDCDRVHQ
jgi:hypothetical protein